MIAPNFPTVGLGYNLKGYSRRQTRDYNKGLTQWQAFTKQLFRVVRLRKEVMEVVTAFDTWKCHICGEERPNDRISVLSKPLVISGQVCGEQNIRYCNDRPACIEGAKDYSFFKKGGEQDGS